MRDGSRAGDTKKQAHSKNKPREIALKQSIFTFHSAPSELPDSNEGFYSGKLGECKG